MSSNIPSATTMPTATARQKELFEDIHDKYYESVDDPVAIRYKEKYVYNRILDFLGPGQSVIELASGIGTTVGWLRRQRTDLQIAGCDISERAVEDFRRIQQAPCHVADLTKPFKLDQTYDVVLIMGGIHHLVADLDAAFANIRGLLKPGGRIIMAEPNADYFLQPVRNLWYKIDKSNFDAANEHALSHDKLIAQYGKDYDLDGVIYLGGIANYFLVLNYILRIPNSLKEFIARPLMFVERLYHKLPGKLPYASFIACWKLR
jgi:SAM-dependent methyltransferase